MRKFRHIVNGILWTIIGLYLTFIVLLHIPAVQSFIGTKVGQAVSEKLGTEVYVGKVDLGLLNRIIIDDFRVRDQQNKELLQATRLSLKFDFLSLLHKRIRISSIQLFGLRANLYKKDAQAQSNFQFVLDSLASKDTIAQTPLDLKINSLIIRRGYIKYNRWDVARKRNQFSTNHIDAKNISAHVIINAVKDDSLNVNVRDLSFEEASGLILKSLTFKLTANTKNATLSSFQMVLPNSKIVLNNLKASYKIKHGKVIMPTLEFDGSVDKSTITLTDLGCFIPIFKKATKPLSFHFTFSGTGTSLKIDSMEVASYRSHLLLQGNGSLRNWQSAPHWAANIKRFSLDTDGIKFITDIFSRHINLPPVISRLGNIEYKGEMGGYGNDISAKGVLTTDAGIAALAFGKHNNKFSARIETEEFKLGKVLENDKFGTISTQIDISGRIPVNNDIYIEAAGDISKFEYNSYAYKNISVDGVFEGNAFDGKLTVNDPNAIVSMAGKFDFLSKHPYAKLTADIEKLSPSALKISNKWPNTQFQFRIHTDIEGKSLNTANGYALLTDFAMKSDRVDYTLSNLLVNINNKENLHHLHVKSDFGQIQLTGKYDYNTLSQSIINLIGSKLPTIPGLPDMNNARTNNFSISGTIERSDWLQHIFNIPVEIEQPLTINGHMSDADRTLNLTLDVPSFTYAGNHFETGNILVKTLHDTLTVSAQVRKVSEENKKFYLALQAVAADNTLSSTLTFDNMRKQRLYGQLKTDVIFYKNEKNVSTAHFAIKPSNILVGDTVWTIQPSEITYNQTRLDVSHFSINHHNQHITIDGTASQNPEDSVSIGLRDIDVNYILNLVNFHSVSFRGLASGTAVLKNPFNTLEGYATLKVKDFKFQDGRMGILDAHINLNNKEGQIDIDAIANDGQDIKTFVNGYISPKHNYIDLAIRAYNSRIEFIESFCGSFMHDVEANANGLLRVFGPLDNINLTGQMIANGNLSITPLNTTYTLRNDTIRFLPDLIEFKADTVYDRNGNIGIVTGYLQHEHLTNLSYNLSIATRNLLAYDFKDFGNSSFCGTVYATGTCDIVGKSGEVNIDINATPEKNSVFAYNVANPEVARNNQFIHWGKNALQIRNDSTNIAATEDTDFAQEDKPEIPTDIRLNFFINCTPDASLRLLMDKQSGDNITLNGSGMIRASYYNKGNFEMFGNYLVDRGIYKLTIQNVIKKDFSFQQGGTIAFGGDPYNAQLNLQAFYTANGVSLSDLNIGRSFSSNNIRVNCLMNITGTPAAPKLTFGLDMPTINSNVKQMIYSLINGEEEMNQQVLYLLAVGRFYTQNRNNAEIDNTSSQSKTSLAMQSLLSSTISQQLNTVLSSVINNNNWSFGANISTGDEGWNNAEYEGILSGRLLNNHLLINGQFGYRDNPNTTTSFIGDFDLRYLLFPNGGLAIKMYNQTNDRYFTRNSLTTQGLGLIMKKDFNGWRDLFRFTRKSKIQQPKSKK